MKRSVETKLVWVKPRLSRADTPATSNPVGFLDNGEMHG